MRKPAVAITIRAFGLTGTDMQELSDACTIAYTNTTGKRLSERDLSRILTDIDIVIAGTEPFTKSVLSSAPDLKIISRVGVGLDSIDCKTARERGIVILSTPLAPVDAVAEHALALILCSLKKIAYYDSCVKEGRSCSGSGSLLAGKTAGIVGIGRIGQKTARLLEGLGCRIHYYDPAAVAGGNPDWVRHGSVTDLASCCDILTLHAPAQPDGRPIIDGDVFSSCKRGITLVNTARGSLIDEAALCRALDDRTVAGAALDVQSVEPYTGPLTRYPQVVLTPHIASNTKESRQQMEKEAVANILSTLEKTA